VSDDPLREDTRPPANGTNWTVIALAGGLLLVVLVVAYFASNRNPNEDKLTNGQVTGATSASREKLCASSATYNLIKHELFRRAAQLRGSDQAAFDQISSAAVVRMENPVMESEDSSTHAVHCSGSLSLDLPPGIAVVGGRRTLTADIDYSVQQAADNSGPVVLISNADPIITPLATLARTGDPVAARQAPEAPAAPETAPDEAAPAPAPAPQPVPQPAPAPAPAPAPQARPSFACANARTSGERAVCSDPGLAALDRSMSAEYRRAYAVAEPDQQQALRQSAHRFYAYRDRCQDRRCIAQAYAGRVREIRDIVEGRWQPQ
jgi:hypothetical protein